MKSSSPKIARSAKMGQFVLTSSRGTKISEVEGMKVSARVGRILTETARQGLSGDERRALIKEHFCKK